MSELITKKLVDRLYETVKDYENSSQYNSLFEEISPHHFYENYHSAILRYYLKYDEVKEVFINWLNENLKNDKKIIFDDYKGGRVKREETIKNDRRIDIVLYSYNEEKVIIIENKSNEASDGKDQLYDYYMYFKKDKKRVEAVFYLNKKNNKNPDLNEEEFNIIKDFFVKGTLINENSFVENVVDNVIKNIKEILTDNNNEYNIRLLALSYEIKNLFNSIIKGENNMEKTKEFADELSKMDDPNDPIIIKIRKIIDAYNDLEEYTRCKYKDYLLNKYNNFLSDKDEDSETSKYKLSDYNGDNQKIKGLYINIIKNVNITLTIDIYFYINEIICELWIKKGKRQLTLIKLIDILKQENPFVNESHRNSGKTIQTDNILDDKKIKEMLDKVIEYAKAISALEPDLLD